MPTKVWAVGEEVLAADFNTFVQEQVVSTFPSLSVLQSSWPNAPVGAMAVTLDTLSRYLHVAAGSAGWVPTGPQQVQVGLTGTLPNSTSLITLGTISIPAVPFARLMSVTATISVSTTATAVYTVQTADSASGGQSRLGRNQGNSTSAHAPILNLALAANTATTLTASGGFVSAPGTTGTVFSDTRLCRMDALLFPA